MNNDITDVKGIKVGHADKENSATGCTVILADGDFTIGADVRGGAPGSREMTLIDSRNAVEQANAIFLTGGSAYGLDAAGGVMEYLKEENIGFQTGGGVVPIVPAAVIYDLEYKSNDYPDQKMAYNACLKADDSKQENKSIGAAAGATCGKIRGIENSSKTVLGHASIKTGELVVAALAVVNAFGDIKNPANGQIIAGAKNKEQDFIDSEKMIIKNPGLNLGFLRENTTLVVVTTNAILNNPDANRVSMMAHSGLSRSIYPVHTLLDGDTIFTLASNKCQADINQVGTIAAEVVRKAIISTVKS